MVGLQRYCLHYLGVDFEGNCSLLHDKPCIVESVGMGVRVAKDGMKYYISFHLIPFLLRLRKCKDAEQVFKLVRKTSVEYIRSVLFMVFLVTGMKAGQCLTVHERIPFLGIYPMI